MALDELYQQVVLDHNRSPRHRQRLDAVTHQARGRDALCGDDILVELEVEDGLVKTAGFSGEACAITTASASMLMSWLAGRRVEEVEAGYGLFRNLLEDADLPDAVELGPMNHLRAVAAYPARVRNALLPWRTALRALSGEA